MAAEWARALVALPPRATDKDGTRELVAAIVYPTQHLREQCCDQIIIINDQYSLLLPQSMVASKSFASLRLPQRSSTSRYEIGREMGVERGDAAFVCLRESVTDEAVRAHEKSTVRVHAGAGEVEICPGCDRDEVVPAVPKRIG